MADSAAPLPDVLTAVRSFVERSGALALSVNRELNEVSMAEFMSDKIEMLGKLIELYGELFQRCNIKSRKLLEEYVHRNDNKDSLSAMESLSRAESEWDAFIWSLAGRLGAAVQQAPPLHTAVPTEHPLTDTASGRQCRLADTAGTRLLVLLRHFA